MPQPDNPDDPAAGRAAGQGRVRGYGLVIVQGESMLPTLHPGDRLLVHWSGRRAAPGRLAVVELPGGRPLSVKRLTRRQGQDWWVERDNPRAGIDSWHVGAIPGSGVRAIVVARLWPLRRQARRRAQ